MTEVRNTASQRLVSLDAFRGITILMMILVNSPGSWSHVYPPLLHASWNGLTPTDLVFPFFLFIVGVSIVLSLTRHVESMAPNKQLVIKIIKRTLIIFALGVVLNLIGSKFEYLRLPGVLQRIALVFLVCSLLFLFQRIKTIIITGIVLLLGYFVLMRFVPVPGFGAGVLEPGMNLAAWIDSKVIPFHMYQGNWDPEGLLSTLPAIGTGITGIIAGYLIKREGEVKEKIIHLFVFGLLMTMAGEMWSWFFPINKNLWTSSYVLYTSGLASMTWAVLIWVIDVKKHVKWAFGGIVFGMNAITAYVLSYLLFVPLSYIPVSSGHSIQSLFMSTFAEMGISPNLVSLIWALLFVVLCYIPVWVLYRMRLFLKV